MAFSVIGAFSVVLGILAVGELVSTKTKAFVPSVFVSAVLFLIGYWTILPADIVAQSSFSGTVVYLAMYLLLTHMGTLMGMKELFAQWRTVIIAFSGLIGVCLMTLTLGKVIFGWETVVAATPPLTGGVVASILMSEAAASKGLTAIAVLATAMYIMQGFFGYPVTAFMLKSEAKRLSNEFRSFPKVNLQQFGAVQEESEEETAEPHKPAKLNRIKIFPDLPEKYQTTYMVLLKLAILALAATKIAPLVHVNEFVICLLIGVVGRETGFLEENALVKAKAFGFLITTLMAFIFAGISKATPEMLGQIAVPLFGIILMGVAGMAAASMFVGKLLGYTKEMAFSVAMTALYGFPADYILTMESIKSVSSSEEEHKYISDKMLPKMLVGGFTTVTIASVIIAGIFVKLL